MIIQFRFWLLISISIFYSWKPANSFSIFNDLSMQYEDSFEADVNSTDMSERRWLLLEQIQSLATLMIQNLTKICPLNQHEYPIFVSTVVRSTLAMIYEKEETLKSIQFYERVLPAIMQNLNTCTETPSTKISIQEFFSHEYPEKILHLDLMRTADDSSKWYNFRRCIRTREHSKFYPGLVPSMIDVLWNSFLIGYFGCMDFWMSIDAWSYMDAAQSTILLPVYKRWKSKFPIAPGYKSKNQSSVNIDQLVNYTEQNDIINVSSVKYMLESLEKCNIILFMKNPSDPIPCFKDVIEDFER